MVGLRERSQPQTRPAISAPPPPPSVNATAADLEADKTSEQAGGNADGKEGYIGPVACD